MNASTILSQVKDAMDEEIRQKTRDYEDKCASATPLMLARRGIAVLDLSLGGISSLGVQTIVRLNHNGKLPFSLTAGDPVSLFKQPRSINTPQDILESRRIHLLNGTVSSVGHTLDISIDADYLSKMDQFQQYGTLWLLIGIDDVSDQRALQAITAALTQKKPLVEMVLGKFHTGINITTQPEERVLSAKSSPQTSNNLNASAETPDLPDLSTLQLEENNNKHQGVANSRIQMASGLNEDQSRCVAAALDNPLTLIYGPPGTGKTKVLVEILIQCLARGERVFICAGSNIAVDNIVEVLSGHIGNKTMVRIGNAIRTTEKVRKTHHIDAIISAHDPTMRELVTRLYELNEEIHEMIIDKKPQKSKYNERLAVLQRYDRLRKRAETDIFREASAVAATLSGTSTDTTAISSINFDTLVIDELSQARLADSLIPLTRINGVRRVIGAGDNRQLPPTVISRSPHVKKALEYTLFDWIVEHHESSVTHFLSVQYRMCKEIVQYSSYHVYSSQLRAHHTVARRRLSDMKSVSSNRITRAPVLWLDTSSPDKFNPQLASYENIGEAKVVKAHVAELQKYGVDPHDIGVIVPYKGQSILIRNMLDSNIDVSTVDGFQGREKEVIIFSLVRSNQKGIVGHVGEFRRLNVALTRAKSHLCIIGNSRSISSNPTLRRLYNYLVETVHCMHEYR